MTKIGHHMFFAIILNVFITPYYSFSATNYSLSAQNNSYGYSGYYFDPESGLCYCKARYFFPRSERFISRDTFDLNNRYAYCEGDPIDAVDPDGHCICCEKEVAGLCEECRRMFLEGRTEACVLAAEETKTGLGESCKTHSAVEGSETAESRWMRRFPAEDHKCLRVADNVRLYVMRKIVYSASALVRKDELELDRLRGYCQNQDECDIIICEFLIQKFKSRDAFIKYVLDNGCGNCEPQACAAAYILDQLFESPVEIHINPEVDHMVAVFRGPSGQRYLIDPWKGLPIEKVTRRDLGGYRRYEMTDVLFDRKYEWRCSEYDERNGGRTWARARLL